MFSCANCTFCTRYAWSWQRHATSSHHDLLEADSLTTESDSQTSEISQGRAMNSCQEQDNDIHNCLSDEGIISDQSQPTSYQQRQQSSSLGSLSQSLGLDNVLNDSVSPPYFSSPHSFPEVNVNDRNDWHPFLSRVHCQLVLLYHGSHRRKMDLVTFRAVMEILKVYKINKIANKITDIL